MNNRRRWSSSAAVAAGPALVDSDTFTFADGNAPGHVCDMVTAPASGETDVLCVNSDTTVSTPSGFTLRVPAVAAQGAYIFTRKATGGEASTVTVVTAGNHPCQVSWSRWSGLVAVDTAPAATQANGIANTSSPAHSTGALAEADELVLAFAALHSIGLGPTAPVWADDYTPVTAATQGTGATAVAGFVGFKSGVGPAAESPSVSWTTSAFDRYMLTVSFTT